MIRSSKRTRRSIQRDRAFVPLSLYAANAVRLEARALTAPALYRFPVGNANRDQPIGVLPSDGLLATVGGAFLPETTESGNSSANNAGQSVASADGTDFQMVASTTVTFTDYDNPNPNSTPVGNYTISANTTAQIQLATTGSTYGIFNNIHAHSEGKHTYALADDSGTSGNPVTLVESYTVYYSPAGSTPSINTMATSLNTNSAVVNVSGNNQGVSNLKVDGNDVWYPTAGYPSSGTVTTSSGSTLTYTVSTSSVNVAVATYFPGGLPYVGSNNPPAGVVWPVYVSAGESVTGSSSPGLTDQATLTTHYDAHF